MSDQLSTADIIKNKVLEYYKEGAVNISISYVIIALLMAFALSMFIYFIYRKTYNGVMYHENFNRSLILLSMVTATVILPISSNLILSLGMVGALSIVRFRTAVKEPMDTVYMFWAIAVGIMTGAGFLFMSVVSSLMIGLLMLALHNFHVDYKASYLIVIQFNKTAEPAVLECLNTLKRYHVKSQTASNKNKELSVEVCLKKDDKDIVGMLSDVDGVENVMMISYKGDLE